MKTLYLAAPGLLVSAGAYVQSTAAPTVTFAVSAISLLAVSGHPLDPRSLLTAEELAIARLVVAGLSSPEIASKRNLTARSSDKPQANLMGKVGVNQTAALVRLCVMNGIA